MTTKPIYASMEHEVLIEAYLDAICRNIREVVEIDKYKDFIDVSNFIIDYHNEYSKNKDTGNWHDFLMIIPLQMSAMITGLLIGVENKDNTISLRIHRELLGQFSLKVMEDLQKIKPVDE